VKKFGFQKEDIITLKHDRCSVFICLKDDWNNAQLRYCMCTVVPLLFIFWSPDQVSLKGCLFKICQLFKFTYMYMYLNELNGDGDEDTGSSKNATLISP